MTIEELWVDLEHVASDGPGIVRRRLFPDSKRNVFLGIAHPSRERVFQLVVPSAAAAAIPELPRTKSIRTEIVSHDNNVVEITVRLVASEMKRVFTPFCEDVAEATAASESDEAAVKALLDRFMHWRRLLASAADSTLSRNEAIGLYGELWVLRNLIIPVCGLESVTVWRGPDRDDHDFVVKGFGIEVKSTGADEPIEVAIHGERQLSTSGLDQLHLIVLKFDALHGGAGQTLVDAVHNVRSKLEGIAVASFNDKLLDSGYLDDDSSSYQDVFYTLREALVFDVRSGFPRIIESDLPPGIGSVEYKLSVAACSSWKCRIEDSRERIHEHWLGK